MHISSVWVYVKSHFSKSVSVCTSSSEMEVAVLQHHQVLLQLVVEYVGHRRRRRMRQAIWLKPWIGRWHQIGLYVALEECEDAGEDSLEPSWGIGETDTAPEVSPPVSSEGPAC